MVVFVALMTLQMRELAAVTTATDLVVDHSDDATFQVWQCRLAVSNPASKALMVSALEGTIR
jgi:hypothetical protein